MAASAGPPGNRAWDGVDGAGCYVYVRPEITEPNGEPTTDNHYLFTCGVQGTWPEGHCTIDVTGFGCDPSPAWYLTWSLPAIPGCILDPDPGDSPHTSARFIYWQLPSYNYCFGNKTLTVTQPGAGSHTRTIQLFFPVTTVGYDPGLDGARNHPSDFPPGGLTGVTPNWFYYWMFTSARWGTPGFDGYCDDHGYTEFRNGAWRTYVCLGGNDPSEPPVGVNEGEAMNGIDTFGYTCRHEQRHVTVLSYYWPNGYDPNNPADHDQSEGDRLPDVCEALLGGTFQAPINGGPFSPLLRDTNGDEVHDGEAYTHSTQNPWIVGLVDESDWSEFGHQTGQ